jgi:hypothetical protein
MEREHTLNMPEISKNVTFSSSSSGRSRFTHGPMGTEWFRLAAVDDRCAANGYGDRQRQGCQVLTEQMIRLLPFFALPTVGGEVESKSVNPCDSSHEPAPIAAAAAAAPGGR